ncbi:MAG: hydrogen peroxide-inducible genes activator [Ginsengibacter sp.]
MNFQQLEYIIAVDNLRHFGRAADFCFVTQPTLSMMIQKLEDELETQIFDRSKQPTVPTQAGTAIILQARKVLFEASRMKEVVNDLNGELIGELRLGIIPTVAPYLLPLFLSSFIKKYPLLKLRIIEQTTEEIIDKLKQQHLDAGILSTPLNNITLHERPLYYEKFIVYAPGNKELMKKKFVIPADINTNNLLLLEEGHCMRAQAINLCELRKSDIVVSNLEYEAGSIETLKKMVDISNGITILPELAAKDLTRSEQKNIRHFKAPEPVREISIVTYHHFIKQRILEVLSDEIQKVIPDDMLSSKRKSITGMT